VHSERASTNADMGPSCDRMFPSALFTGALDGNQWGTQAATGSPSDRDCRQQTIAWVQRRGRSATQRVLSVISR
jgi:hypothetical protein